MNDAPLPAPGWYADPDQPAGQRYWNGSRWTDERRGAAPPSGVAPRSGGDNSNAIVALVLSILGIVACGLLSPVGMIMGRNELRRIDDGLGDPSARGMANAAHIVGVIGTVLLALLVIGALLVIAIAVGTST